MERLNCTLSLLRLYRKTSHSPCVPLSVTRPPRLAASSSPPPPPLPSPVSSGYFLVFQLPTWSAFRPFRGLSLKRSSNTSQRYGSPSLSLSAPSSTDLACTRVHTRKRSTAVATHGTPTVVKIHRFHFRRGDEKTFTVSIPARCVQGTTLGPVLKQNQGRSTTRFIHRARVSSSYAAWPDIPF